MKTCRLILLLVMALFVTTFSKAQSTMDVSKFTRLDNDLTARITKPVRDNDEGKLCALIRVITNLKDIEFRADALGIVKTEQHNGEVWIYVPYGARSLSFAHEGYFPVVYQYEGNIDEGVVYELRLKSYTAAETAAGSSTNTQMFVLSHNPDDASVFVDGVEVKSENGVFAAMMSKGKHTYKVEADKYASQEGDFEVTNDIVRVDAKLKPLFGQFTLYTLPVEGFDVFLNGKNVGKSPYQSEKMEPGKYQVRLEKNKYYAKDTLITVRKAETTNYTCTLTSFADSLFYNRRLGGRAVSLGISAGYLMPTVSTSAGGSFVGSPLNYSFADTRENANYKSEQGFTVGLLADIRLYKNFYLMSGVNYTYYKYKNAVNNSLKDYTSLATQSAVYIGNNDFDVEEDYTMHTLEVPLLLSYRFVLTKTGSLHLNAGPFVSYGLKANLKVSGSTNTYGNVYTRIGQDVLMDSPVGTFNNNEQFNSNLDLYSKTLTLKKTVQSGGSLGHNNEVEHTFDKSPYNRFNYGLKFGVAYELKGFQLGVNYNLMLSNMANKEYWEGTRLPMFNGLTGDNNMSGYKQRINSIEVKLGYVLRY